MYRLNLSYLTFIGAGVEDASVDFGPTLTLVRGPSDTGKSFVVDAIDFMLGANALKEIPEREGYSTALLGLVLPNGDNVTLARQLNGGSLALHYGYVRRQELGAPDQILSAKHSATSESNLSRYLLSQIGLDGKRIRKNARNETDSLSFRNICHLCVVNEIQMQSEVAPALTGQYVTRTKEISTLKLLLQDEDDSNLVPTGRDADNNRLSNAKNDVIDRMVADLEAQLSEVTEADKLREQLERLNAALAEHGSSIERLSRARDQIAAARAASQREESVIRSRVSEATALASRFRLLHEQYDSDLARLAMVTEAGNLLGYFRPGQCVFCGAEPQHQHLNELCEGDSTYFGQSIEAEREKTTSLRDDLVVTLEDLQTEVAALRARLSGVREHLRRIDQELTEADGSLRPHRGALSELLGKKSVVEKQLGLYDQISKLEALRSSLSEESKADSSTAVSSMSLYAVREFSAEISRRLEQWGFPDPDMVRYGRSEQDVIAGDQLRAAHGKGVRAILHAAFSVALAQYCFDRDIPHPGFTILDSPLVTYRPPDDVAEDDPSFVRDYNAVVDAFYNDIQRNFAGQIIVMENVNPSRSLDEGSTDIVFTKQMGLERYGFFPPSRRARLD